MSLPVGAGELTSFSGCEGYRGVLIERFYRMPEVIPCVALCDQHCGQGTAFSIAMLVGSG